MNQDQKDKSVHALARDIYRDWIASGRAMVTNAAKLRQDAYNAAEAFYAEPIAEELPPPSVPMTKAS